MRHIVTICAVSLGVLSCAAAASQEPEYEIVLPGSDQLNSTRITPHAVRYERRGGGFMNYDLQLAEMDGRPVYQLHIQFNTETGPPDQMFFDPETLGYIGRHLELADYTVDVRFSDGHFTGNLTPAADSDREPVVYDKNYPHGGFEPAVMNYWIAALPLREGYTASLPVFDLSNGSTQQWANIEVLQREVLEIDGRAFDTWKVESRGIRKKTIWVSTTEPYAIKMITQGSFQPWVVAMP